MKILAKWLSLLAFIPLVSQNSCVKNLVGDRYYQAQRWSYVLEERWGLTSAKSIPQLSSGKLHNYRGIKADSLNVTFSVDPNLGNYAFVYSLRGINATVGIDSVISPLSISMADTSTIAYDTLLLNGPWMPSYGDTLFMSKASPTALVFQMSYSDSLGKGVEVDSFHIIGVH